MKNKKGIFTNTGNIGIDTTSPKHTIEVKCLCGNTSFLDVTFNINIFFIYMKCMKCGKIIAIPNGIY